MWDTTKTMKWKSTCLNEFYKFSLRHFDMMYILCSDYYWLFWLTIENKKFHSLTKKKVIEMYTENRAQALWWKYYSILLLYKKKTKCLVDLIQLFDWLNQELRLILVYSKTYRSRHIWETSSATMGTNDTYRLVHIFCVYFCAKRWVKVSLKNNQLFLLIIWKFHG